MKRIGAVLLSVCLLLACAVPAGAYLWSGQSFIDDYYGVSPLNLTSDSWTISDTSFLPVSMSFLGTPPFSLSFSSFSSSSVTNSILYAAHSKVQYSFPSTSYSYSFSASGCDFVFSFSEPLSSFSFSGSLFSMVQIYFDGLAGRSYFYPDFSILVDGVVVQKYSGAQYLDVSGFSYSSRDPITSFSVHVDSYSGSGSVSRPNGLSFVDLRYSLNSVSSNLFSISTVPYSPPASDFEYTVKTGEDLAQDVKLSSGVTTGGGNVYWSYDSYETGHPPYTVTVPGGAAHQMAPVRFPSISLSKSGASVTASIPSTSYTFSWAGGCRVEHFETLLTGPPGFSGPGSAALDYIDFEIPFSSDEDVHNFELDGAVSVETAYRAGSNSASRVGGSWSLLVNGALVNSGTTDTYGNIQFNNFIYYSSEPISSLTLRLVPTAAGLAFPSNTGSITFSWAVTLGLDGLSMVYLEGEDEAINLDRFYSQINDAQNSIDGYDKIENQWTANMTSNWNALKMDSFSFDAGLISGFALLTGIFNDIWTAFGVFNVVWIVPLMLGIALLVIGRISRNSGAGKGE